MKEVEEWRLTKMPRVKWLKERIQREVNQCRNIEEEMQAFVEIDRHESECIKRGQRVKAKLV